MQPREGRKSRRKEHRMQRHREMPGRVERLDGKDWDVTDCYASGAAARLAEGNHG